MNHRNSEFHQALLLWCHKADEFLGTRLRSSVDRHPTSQVQEVTIARMWDASIRATTASTWPTSPKACFARSVTIPTAVTTGTPITQNDLYMPLQKHKMWHPLLDGPVQFVMESLSHAWTTPLVMREGDS